LRTFLPILPNPFIATFTGMNKFPPKRIYKTQPKIRKY